VETRYRVWIVRFEQWQPDDWHDVPPGAIAVEPAERGTMTGRRARQYVEAFNRAAHDGRRRIWAVALPVTIRYLGDPRPGETLAATGAGTYGA
jgi:broad specificity phosphatase PhoE